MKKIPVERTKKGYPALWERGGGYTNTGEATIIASAEGKKKKPVYIRRRGHLACAEHALFVIEKGDYIIEANHHREDFYIEIFKINNFETNIEKNKYLSFINQITDVEFITKYGSSYEEVKEKHLKHYINDIPNSIGYYKINENLYARRWCDNCIEIYEVKEKERKEDVAITELMYEFSRGEWDKEPPAHLKPVIKAAKEKATCYHCREPHFIVE